MACRERGIALLTVLFLLALLMILAMTLAEKTLRATRGSALAGAREQALQAAAGGAEWARHRLASTYRASNGWATYLAGAPDGERYPTRPAFQTSIGGMAVDIFLRDNPDGDGDPRRDNDLHLFVLVCARPPVGADVRVEVLCGVDPGRWQESRAGTAADGPTDPLSAPLLGTFRLRD